MKTSSIILAGTFAIASAFASAKASYVSGKVESINTELQTISIIEEGSKELKIFKYSDAAKTAEKRSEVALASLKEGDKITLKLEAK